MDDLSVTIELDKTESGSVSGVILKVTSPSRQMGVAVFMSRDEAYELADDLETAASEVAW
jgi:hypothetical protein